jgi:hypothetical protein
MPTRIKDIASQAATPDSTDFIPLDGNAFGTRRMPLSDLRDTKGNVRSIPQNAQTAAYPLVAADAGKHVAITTGGVTVPQNVFSAGDAISIYNNSASSQTITSGTGITMYLAGSATTGNRTLAQRGVATVLCVGSNTFVISGAGLT